MKMRSAIWLAVTLVLIGVLGYVSLSGVSFGIYRVKPLPEAIKQGLDITGGVSVVYQAKNLDDPDLAKNLDMAMTIFRTRLTSEGFPEATITQQGNARIRIEIPINESSAIQDPNMITQYLVKTAKVEFKDPNGNVLFEGKDMEQVDVGMAKGNEYVVSFKLNSAATAIFAKATQEFLKQKISIYLDGNLISDPTVDSTIPGGEGYIEGGFTADSARQLAQQIRSGVLPLEMEELEVRSISATLGDEALQKSITAGLIGLALVFIYILVWYRLPGLMADIALLIYMIIMLFALATIPGVQLTLPGIAGIILSVGMAVDANVVIFERFKEEVRSGKTIRTAVKSGFSRAFSAILDSNVTTIIAALVLLFFGTGPIKGFAITLLIGIITSFISAVFVTRGLLNLMLGLGITDTRFYIPARKGAAQ